MLHQATLVSHHLSVIDFSPRLRQWPSVDASWFSDEDEDNPLLNIGHLFSSEAEIEQLYQVKVVQQALGDDEPNDEQVEDDAFNPEYGRLSNSLTQSQKASQIDDIESVTSQKRAAKGQEPRAMKQFICSRCDKDLESKAKLRMHRVWCDGIQTQRPKIDSNLEEPGTKDTETVPRQPTVATLHHAADEVSTLPTEQKTPLISKPHRTGLQFGHRKGDSTISTQSKDFNSASQRSRKLPAVQLSSQPETQEHPASMARRQFLAPAGKGSLGLTRPALTTPEGQALTGSLGAMIRRLSQKPKKHQPQKSTLAPKQIELAQPSPEAPKQGKSGFRESLTQESPGRYNVLDSDDYGRDLFDGTGSDYWDGNARMKTVEQVSNRKLDFAPNESASVKSVVEDKERRQTLTPTQLISPANTDISVERPIITEDTSTKTVEPDDERKLHFAHNEKTGVKAVGENTQKARTLVPTQPISPIYTHVSVERPITVEDTSRKAAEQEDKRKFDFAPNKEASMKAIEGDNQRTRTLVPTQPISATHTHISVDKPSTIDKMRLDGAKTRGTASMNVGQQDSKKVLILPGKDVGIGHTQAVSDKRVSSNGKGRYLEPHEGGNVLVESTPVGAGNAAPAKRVTILPGAGKHLGSHEGGKVLVDPTPEGMDQGNGEKGEVDDELIQLPLLSSVGLVINKRLKLYICTDCQQAVTSKSVANHLNRNERKCVNPGRLSKIDGISTEYGINAALRVKGDSRDQSLEISDP
ncbi:hypothetical protein EST38_g9724 [Candolleomyces aberdarensis]|uniref:Uncharacterized protein n=1 Tax=Candolleomyces aberdarensis TaxID=2316362 RepID=A0A4Q2DBK1_9AGAR|nr:hypothetical protein EST38_g9724 [Candolleomyces aberdarensis]